MKKYNIVALCKTHMCNEFIEAAIESIYDHVDKIVFVNSDVDWLGVKSKNEVVGVVNNWKSSNDTMDKIFNFEANVDNQYLQYNIGYHFIKDVYNPQWILCFDTDEIWDKSNILRLVKYSREFIEYNAIHSYMHTYIKSPFYRVTPPEMCKPCVLFRPIHKDIFGIRGNQTGNSIIPSDLFFHHFTYVRRNESDVFKKIQTSLVGDRDDVPNCDLVDIGDWIINKWNKLPNAVDFHTTKHFERSWHKIVKIKLNDLPETLQNKEILRIWSK